MSLLVRRAVRRGAWALGRDPRAHGRQGTFELPTRPAGCAASRRVGRSRPSRASP